MYVTKYVTEEDTTLKRKFELQEKLTAEMSKRLSLLNDDLKMMYGVLKTPRLYVQFRKAEECIK